MTMTILLTVSAAALIARTIYFFARKKKCNKNNIPIEKQHKPKAFI